MSKRFHKHTNFLMPIFNRIFFGIFVGLVLYNCCFAYEFRLTPFLIIVGVTFPVFTMTEGIILDSKKGRYKHYLQVYGFKLRKWHPYADMRLVLIIKRVSAPSVIDTVGNFYGMASAGDSPDSSRRKIRSFHYAFCIEVKNNDHLFYIKQSSSIEKLTKFAKPYEAYTDIPLEDCIPEKYR